MMQIPKSPADFNQNSLHVTENYHLFVPDDLKPKKTHELTELLVVEIKKYSFVVDWQLQENESLEF